MGIILWSESTWRFSNKQSPKKRLVCQRENFCIWMQIFYSEDVLVSDSANLFLFAKEMESRFDWNRFKPEVSVMKNWNNQISSFKFRFFRQRISSQIKVSICLFANFAENLHGIRSRIQKTCQWNFFADSE